MLKSWRSRLSTAISKYTPIVLRACGHAIAMSYRFPVQSMVIEPREGRVLHGLNANELLDVQDDKPILDSPLYVGKL